MSLPIYQRVAVTDAGDVIPGAEYTVINENTGLAQPIYSDRSGSSLKSAPYFADSAGTIQFFIAQGTTFRVAASGGVGTYTDRYVYGVAEAVLVQADGNVGIGTSSPVEKLYVNSTSGDARIGLNAPTGSDTEIKFSNNGSVEYSIGHDDGTDNFVIGTANVDLPLLSVTKAGNVGIGTSSPRTTLDLGMPTLSSTLSRTLTDYQMMLEAPSGGGSRYAHNIGWSEITGSSVVVAAINAIDLGASSATGITFATGNSASIAERVRIDSNGSLLVGKAVADVSVPGSVLNANGTVLFTASGAKVVNVNRTGTDGTAVGFSNDGAQVGTISVSGSATAYNTSSDYRLKEDEVAMTGATERVKALRPVNFAWKADGSRVDGFFAHELAEVVPEAATGIKDAMMDEEYEVTPAVYEDVIIPAVEAVLDEDGVVITEAVEESTESVLVTEAVMGTRSVPDYQGIDQSKLVPLLTATIQELIARIEALEAGA